MFQALWPDGLYHNRSKQLLEHKSSHMFSTWMSVALFKKCHLWTLKFGFCIIPMSKIFFCFLKALKNVKFIFSCQAIQKQQQARFGPWAAVCHLLVQIIINKS